MQSSGSKTVVTDRGHLAPCAVPSRFPERIRERNPGKASRLLTLCAWRERGFVRACPPLELVLDLASRPRSSAAGCSGPHGWRGSDEASSAQARMTSSKVTIPRAALRRPSRRRGSIPSARARRVISTAVASLSMARAPGCSWGRSRTGRPAPCGPCGDSRCSPLPGRGWWGVRGRGPRRPRVAPRWGPPPRVMPRRFAAQGAGPRRPAAWMQ